MHGALAAAIALLACTAASAEAPGPGEGKARLRAEAVLQARSGVVLLRTATGICSGVVLDAEAGVLASSADRLAGSGGVTAFAFREVSEEAQTPRVERVELGPARVRAVHRTVDAALLEVDAAGLEGLRAVARSPREPGAGQRVFVSGVQGAVGFESAADLDARAGEVLAGAEAGRGSLAMSAPVHLNSAGGAVLDREFRILAVASRRRPGGAWGSAVPLAVFDRLRAGTAPVLDPEALEEHLAVREGVPPHLAPSPGGPEGRRVRVGEGMAVIREARAVVAQGFFVRDSHDPLEYFACPLENGKLHETVIATRAEAKTFTFALTMLDYSSGGGVETLGDTRTPFGDRVRMFVEWDVSEARAIGRYLQGVDPPWKRPEGDVIREKVAEGAISWEPGPRVRARAEDLMFDRDSGRPMEHISWVYTGSRFRRNEETRRHEYMADINGVLAAVYRDPSAVFNTSLETGEDDIYYCVNDAMVPPRGTSCTLIILPAEAADDDAPDRDPQEVGAAE